MLSDILQQILCFTRAICSSLQIIDFAIVKCNIMFYYIYKLLWGGVTVCHPLYTEVIRLNKITKIKYYIDSLCIYDFKDDGIIDKMYKMLSHVDNEGVLRQAGDFFRAVSAHGSLKEYISRLILTDDNIFTRAACGGNEDRLKDNIIDAVKTDLMKLEFISSLSTDDVIDNVKNNDYKEILRSMPRWYVGNALSPLTTEWDGQLDDLCRYHRENGYGKFAKHIAFTWRGGELCPVTSIAPITLNDLKNYEEQRQKVVDNTESFVSGHPANNVLLYGDRGTGKSSTVHALLNEYHNKGLRMIEIPKSTVSQLTLIREAISDSPLKFIIYIDDLSFDSNDSSFSELKAALEGSLSGKQANTLIYATSNRRHLIKESFSDRQNEMNLNDIMQEQLSLSDRFGLSVTFLNPDKNNYLEIIEKICHDRGLNVDREHLFNQAEKWAIRRGGRSPRCAKQFIDFVESCELRGKEW